MQNLVNIYNTNITLIQKFIKSSLKQVDLNTKEDELKERLFKVFPSLELMYTVDKEYFQNSKNVFRTKKEEIVSNSRSYLIDSEVSLYFNEPYLSTATDNLCITVSCKTENGYLLLDFNVRSLLERFDLIHTKRGMNLVNKISYGAIGGGLLFFGLFLVGYGFYYFGTYLFTDKIISLEILFKPIIALTLGLAVYDLGKTILDEEVLPTMHDKKEGFNANTLLKFSMSIIIALLIEALLVVFKISLIDYKDLLYGAGLIGAVSILILVFAIFIYLIRKSEKF